MLDGKRETGILKTTALVCSRRRFVGVFQDTGMPAGISENSNREKSLWGLYPLNTKDYNPHNNHCQDMGECFMIIFNNLWITMKKRKISTYQLRGKTRASTVKPSVD